MSPDLDWLRSLAVELWPASERQPFSNKALRELTADEWGRLLKVTQEAPLIVEMCCTSMFGGVGITLYSHPIFPGLPPEPILLIAEGHVPGYGPARASLGSCRQASWAMFFELSSTESNKRWLAQHKLNPPKPSAYYDY